MDPSLIQTTLAGFQILRETIGAAIQVSDSTKGGEVRDKLDAARMTLSDVLDKYEMLRIEYYKAAERIRELETALDQARHMKFEFGAYWSVREDGSYDGPFDSLSWDSDKSAIRAKCSGLISDTSEIGFGYGQRYFKVPVTFLQEHRVFSEVEMNHLLSPRRPPRQGVKRIRPGLMDGLL